MSEIERLTVERDQARLAARTLASEIRFVVRHVQCWGSLQRNCAGFNDLKEALRRYEALKIIEPS